VPFILKTCRDKAIKDYRDCTLVIVAWVQRLTYFPHFLNTISGGGFEGLDRQPYEMKNLALQIGECRLESLD